MGKKEREKILYWGILRKGMQGKGWKESGNKSKEGKISK